MSARAPWWTGIPALQAELRCGPGHHRLRWEEGRLTSLDHPDLAGEEVLAGLLAETPPCLAVLAAWRDHAADPSVLTVGSRHPGDTISVEAATLAAAQRTADRPSPGRSGLLRLLALPAGLQRRLQAEVAAALTTGAPPAGAGSEPARFGSAAEAVVEAATVGRLTPVVRRWAGVSRVTVSVAPSGAGAERADGGGVSVTVGPAWLSEVWGRYLGAVDGFLVLGVERIVEDRAQVTGVAEPGGEAVRLTLTGPAPWRVEARLDR